MKYTQKVSIVPPTGVFICLGANIEIEDSSANVKNTKRIFT